jgi:hypothetical protein
MKIMQLLRAVITLFRILLLIGHLWTMTHGVGARSSPDKDHERALRLERERTTQANLNFTIEEQQARQLIQRWCSAYAQLNPAGIVELQASEVEIVERFGDLHRLSARQDQERFWAEGFDIIQAREFHPQCETVDVVFISPHAAMVHANVSYPHGIRLKGGERIPPYSEIHTFVIAGNEGPWLISGHNVTKQVSP